MITGGEAADIGRFVVPAVGTVWAAVVDVARREIPDRIPTVMVVWAIAAESLGWLPFSWLSLVLGFATALIVGTIGFWCNSLGGGDVKLLAAVGASVGVSGVWSFLFWTAVAGGLLGVVAGYRGERELAFAPAIAAGWGVFTFMEVTG